MTRNRHGVRRQSGSGDGAFGRTMNFQISTCLVRAKAVSRYACHRLVSPKSDEGGSPRRWCENGLVAGTGGVTVSAAMKTLSGENWGDAGFASSILIFCLLACIAPVAKSQGTLDALTSSFTVVSGPPNVPPFSQNIISFVQGGAGWAFTPTENILVTAIASTTPQVNFWIGSSPLANFNYSVGSYDYNFESITPLLLLAGQNYTVTAQYPNFTALVNVTAGSILGDAGPTVSMSPSLSLNGYSLLTTNGQLTTYSSDIVLLGPNFQFQVAPEPSTVGLSFLGLGLFSCTQKFRRRLKN